jgi:type II secretory pathway component GspD/PulD (secretin)
MTRLLATLLALMLAAAPAAAQQDDEAITLNLRDADILEVIAMVSEVTGRNFVVDPRVRARVTVISARPLSQVVSALEEELLIILAAIVGKRLLARMPATMLIVQGDFAVDAAIEIDAVRMIFRRGKH